MECEAQKVVFNGKHIDLSALFLFPSGNLILSTGFIERTHHGY